MTHRPRGPSIRAHPQRAQRRSQWLNSRLRRSATTGDRSLPIFAEFDRLADRIRLEAYNLFARRGDGESRALDDWLKAEREDLLARREARGARWRDFVLEVALPGFEPSRDLGKQAHAARKSWSKRIASTLKRRGGARSWRWLGVLAATRLFRRIDAARCSRCAQNHRREPQERLAGSRRAEGRDCAEATIRFRSLRAPARPRDRPYGSHSQRSSKAAASTTAPWRPSVTQC